MHSYPRLLPAAAPHAQSSRTAQQIMFLNADVNLFVFIMLKNCYNLCGVGCRRKHIQTGRYYNQIPKR